MEYDVTITEVGKKNFVIEAKDRAECIKKTKAGYKSGLYVLDYENVDEVRIKVEEIK